MAKNTKIYIKGKELSELAEISNNTAQTKATFPPDTVKWKDGSVYKTYEQFGTGQFKKYAPNYVYSKEATNSGKTLGQAFKGLTASAKGYRPWNTLRATISSPGTYTLTKNVDGSIFLGGNIIIPAIHKAQCVFVLLCGGGGGGGGNHGNMFGGFGGAGGGGGAVAVVAIMLDTFNTAEITVGAGGAGGSGNFEDEGMFAISGGKTSVTVGSYTISAGGGTFGRAQNSKQESAGGTYIGLTKVAGVFEMVARVNGGNGGGIKSIGKPSIGYNATYAPEGQVLFSKENISGGSLDTSNGAVNYGGGGGGSIGIGGNGGGGTTNSPGKHGNMGSGGGGAGNYASRTLGGNGGDGYVEILY